MRNDKMACSHEVENGVVHGTGEGLGSTWCGKDRVVRIAGVSEFMFRREADVNCIECIAAEPR